VPALEALATVKAQAAQAAIPWRSRRAGDRLRLGAVTLAIHHPPPPDWERRKVRNDDSLVLDVRYGEVSIVLAGDIGRPVEPGVAATVPPASLRIVKVPHHGSSTSSSWPFVSALRPALAIVTAGPTTRVNEEVLGRYRDVGARIFRTDLHGAITVETDGHAVTVCTFTGERWATDARAQQRRQADHE